MPDTLHKRKNIGKLKLLKTSWRHQTKVFFENSTLHGVRYIAEEGRPVYENFMWFVFVTLSTIVTLIIIVSLWEKFQTNPTITGLDTDFHNWDVPFPGISICPSRPFSHELVDEYVKKRWGDSLSEEKAEYYNRFVTIIGNLSYNNLHEIAAFEGDKTLPEDDFRSIVYEIAVRCEETVEDCYWKGEEYNCCLGFFPTFTEKGFCYSFNTLGSEREWPWRVSNETLEIKVNYIYETDTKWTIEFNGRSNATENVYDIYIHTSDELPGYEMPPQYAWKRTVSKMFFAAKTTYTTEDARQLSAKQRKCIFEDEVKLETAPKYSYWSCMSDCRMRAALKMCHCVPHFYHRVHRLKNSLNCPCELGCMNTVYEVEKFNNANDEDEPLEIGFVSWPMIRYKREVLFGWVDLLVAFGGIAGLFLGFSLLSGVEIIYYFTMRAGCMVYQDSDTLRKIEEEEEAQVYTDIDLSLKIKKEMQKTIKVPVKFQEKKKYTYVPFLN